MKQFISTSLFLGICLWTSLLWGGGAGRVLQEALEAFARRPPRGLTDDAVRVIVADMSRLASRYGDDLVLAAMKKSGPETVSMVLRSASRETEEHALRLLARHGKPAIMAASRPTSLALLAKFGDDAGEALVRHGTIAEPLIENYGTPMAQALRSVNSRNARRLAMLEKDGILARIPQRDDVLKVVAKYGDSAADWIWKNKGSITVAAVVAAFVANPEAFLRGTGALVGTVFSSFLPSWWFGLCVLLVVFVAGMFMFPKWLRRSIYNVCSYIWSRVYRNTKSAGQSATR